MNIFQRMFYRTPNRYAARLKLNVDAHKVIVSGYQNFELTSNEVKPLDKYLTNKFAQIRKLARYLKNRSVLDLGANAGFFSFFACLSQASKVTAVDIDRKYLSVIRQISKKFDFDIKILKSNIDSLNEPHDVVFCLDLVHWIFSCTEGFGSLDRIIEKLGQLTNYMLIIDWVSPDDEAIKFFKHLDFNKQLIREEYNIDNFEKALSRHFIRHAKLKNIRPTRVLYTVFKTTYDINLNIPFSPLYPRDTIIKSGLLAKHDDKEYWCCVYDLGDKIVKQTSPGMAEREHRHLCKLDSDYFPRSITLYSRDNYSVIELEKIHGETLSEDHFGSDLIIECLRALKELKDHNITHRDIRIDNIIVRNRKPVILDFGWAVEGHSNEMIRGLGKEGRPKDGSYCDIYSMGKVFKQLNNNPRLDHLIELMTKEKNRETNIDILIKLFAEEFHKPMPDGEENEKGTFRQPSDDKQFLKTGPNRKGKPLWRPVYSLWVRCKAWWARVN